ncbi:hypothetical protein CF394_08575 [Tetzosporium hominis]|uniref:Knr4/Smi1-like domain-containing protein n=1 Tax=Tetzosporium hominis TaxID=2020506 RepID=A0A264W2L3_9BACL|nr:SMI1/KNR4 family protein [Tetzosporium hominis]OZS77799.1 hypothetical protein CF394_08575 [Tetzosporium hominis]
MKIWREDTEEYQLAPLTNKMVKEAEENLKVKLPKSYINLLKTQNGGYINYDSFPTKVPTSWAEDHIHVDYLFGIAENKGILQSAYLIQEWDLPKDIVLISGDGHSWVALDYRKTNEEPPILYIDAESNQVIEIARSFKPFIKGLYLEEREFEEIDFEEECLHLTHDELEAALSTNNDQDVIQAMNYLFENTMGNEQFIEQKLLALLQRPSLEIKQLAANFANHFNEMGIISSSVLSDMVTIIRNDEEIEYFADMFFADQ